MWGKNTDKIEELLRETNGLLRELLLHVGRSPLTPKAGQPPRTPLDGSAVTRVTRETILQREREAEAKRNAPWRDGPAPAPTVRPSGDPLNPTTGYEYDNQR